MNIRHANQNDLSSIVEIYNQAILASQKTADLDPVNIEERTKWFKEHVPDKYPIFVAEKDNVILGYLSISPYRPGRMALRHTAEISYYIHFDHHRKGVASNLIRHAIDACDSLQIKTLFAIIIDSNEASVWLLEKFGFTKWGHLPGVAEFDGCEFGHLYYGLRINE
jgi:phosphinothricin acetyltransferase